MKRDWAKIPKQTILGFGKDDKTNPNAPVGDCFRCCVAAILGLSAQEVPHFVEIQEREGKDSYAATQDWLSKKGYWFLVTGVMYFGYNSLLYLPVSSETKLAELPVISCGPTVRSKTSFQTHCVVSDLVSDKLLYDPHPSEVGLLSVNKTCFIIPHYGS